MLTNINQNENNVIEHNILSNINDGKQMDDNEQQQMDDDNE